MQNMIKKVGSRQYDACSRQYDACSRKAVREVMDSNDELQNWNPVMKFNLLNLTDTESFRMVFSSNLVILNVIFKPWGDFLQDLY